MCECACVCCVWADGLVSGVTKQTLTDGDARAAYEVRYALLTQFECLYTLGPVGSHASSLAVPLASSSVLLMSAWPALLMQFIMPCGRRHLEPVINAFAASNQGELGILASLSTFPSHRHKLVSFWGKCTKTGEEIESSINSTVHHGLNVYKKFAFVSSQQFATASQF